MHSFTDKGERERPHIFDNQEERWKRGAEKIQLRPYRSIEARKSENDQNIKTSSTHEMDDAEEPSLACNIQE